MNDFSRRDFLKGSLAIATGAGVVAGVKTQIDKPQIVYHRQVSIPYRDLPHATDADIKRHEEAVLDSYKVTSVPKGAKFSELNDFKVITGCTCVKTLRKYVVRACAKQLQMDSVTIINNMWDDICLAVDQNPRHFDRMRQYLGYEFEDGWLHRERQCDLDMARGFHSVYNTIPDDLQKKIEAAKKRREELQSTRR